MYLSLFNYLASLISGHVHLVVIMESVVSTEFGLWLKGPAFLENLWVFQGPTTSSSCFLFKLAAYNGCYVDSFIIHSIINVQ